MNKLIAAILCVMMVGATALPAAAQTRARSYTKQSYARHYNNTREISHQQRARYDNRQPAYNVRNYYGYDNRSFWQKHRDKLTVAGGTLGGAMLGSLFGGRKGAIIGALAGGGGSAIYSYKIRNRNRRY